VQKYPICRKISHSETFEKFQCKNFNEIFRKISTKFSRQENFIKFSVTNGIRSWCRLCESKKCKKSCTTVIFAKSLTSLIRVSAAMLFITCGNHHSTNLHNRPMVTVCMRGFSWLSTVLCCSILWHNRALRIASHGSERKTRNEYRILQCSILYSFLVFLSLPCDAIRRARLCHRMSSVCPSVSLSVCDVHFSHRLEYFENNSTAD